MSLSKDDEEIRSYSFGWPLLADRKMVHLWRPPLIWLFPLRFVNFALRLTNCRSPCLCQWPLANVELLEVQQFRHVPPQSPREFRIAFVLTVDHSPFARHQYSIERVTGIHNVKVLANYLNSKPGWPTESSSYIQQNSQSTSEACFLFIHPWHLFQDVQSRLVERRSAKGKIRRRGP